MSKAALSRLLCHLKMMKKTQTVSMGNNNNENENHSCTYIDLYTFLLQFYLFIFSKELTFNFLLRKIEQVKRVP